jgi:hypothetical protein
VTREAAFWSPRHFPGQILAHCARRAAAGAQIALSKKIPNQKRDGQPHVGRGRCTGTKAANRRDDTRSR